VRIASTRSPRADAPPQTNERCAISKPEPASLPRSCPRSFLPLAVARFVRMTRKRSRCSLRQDDNTPLAPLRTTSTVARPFFPLRGSAGALARSPFATSAPRTPAADHSPRRDPFAVRAERVAPFALISS